jgi:molybdenum cofactor cytidylyltransferase
MSDRSEAIAGVVLAAGGSRRMPGGPKLARPWPGEGSVLRAATVAALEAGLFPVVVVLGHEAERLRALIDGLDVQVRVQEAWNTGRAASLSAGIEALGGPGSIPAAAVLLGDEPGARPSTIRRVIDAWRRSGADVVRARYRDRPGHPVVLGPRALAASVELRGDASLVTRLASAGLSLEEILVPSDAPVDVDTPEALDRARRAAETSAEG